MYQLQRLPRVRPAVAIVSLVFALSACSGEGAKREYATPDRLCGTALRTSLLDPFLPGGKQIDVRLADTGVIGMRRCNVTVDGEKTMALSTVWSSPGTAVSQISASWPRIDVSEHVAKDGSHSYSEEGGVSKVSCPRPDKTWRDAPGQLFVVVYALNTTPENEQKMRELVTGYARAVGVADECN
ncbi:hypothetical protein OG897_20515 [Streptomyces sp. NBC_00237]|uniref:hypothetical protein n=1 Tax=Streptomyces sp. NBC_00237 TaxID=2975687 RepID=UPI00224C8121|nr:hypothetical protein [Streptomyces sp. NBC_00237]MCX5203827.1 hypothetical protein [Streptomyces sp. NBC_00237]